MQVNEVEAKLIFKCEGVEGIVPVGSYLADASKRLGIRFADRCEPTEKVHHCAIRVVEGEGLLSPPTAAEAEYFEFQSDNFANRLACQARIEEEGELVVMTTESEEKSKEAKESEDPGKEFAKTFADLPLEKKIAQLVNLEAITLGETISFVMNSPFMVFDKVMDVMAEFGMKKEEFQKEAAKPAEHVRKEKKSAGKRSVRVPKPAKPASDETPKE